jgi:hypothetical protein
MDDFDDGYRKMEEKMDDALSSCNCAAYLLHPKYKGSTILIYNIYCY